MTNDGDTPLAVIVEVHGFRVNEAGSIGYDEIDHDIKVEFGASSFVIPPHGSHIVFYKAQASKANAWFSFLSTFTKAAPDPKVMRINFVLPHVVYLYQKQKLKKDDISLSVLPQANGDDLQIEVQNHSAKLGRVERVSWHGCEHNGEIGGFPVFPSAKRRVQLPTGTLSPNASAKVIFQDGFSVQVPLK